MLRNRVVLYVCTVLALSAIGVGAQTPDPKSQLAAGIDAKRQGYENIALQIWKFAETGNQEVKSSALLVSRLTDEGFSMQTGVAGLATAGTLSPN